MEQALEDELNGDVIIVDEAAAFPVFFLKRVADQTHRVIFSTTTDGYEGTGQGFRLKFDPYFRERHPKRRWVMLDTPVRWDISDPVEQTLSKAFCLASAPKANRASRWCNKGIDCFIFRTLRIQ